MNRAIRWWVVLVAACLGVSSLSGESAAPAAATAPLPWPAGLPVYDHVVIVVEENKDFEQIIGNPNASYINALREEGATLTRMFGEEHNSQGNYFWLFSGSNQNVGFDDKVPPKGQPFDRPNLGAALFKKGLSFRGYSEDLPKVGSEDEFAPDAHGKRSYARKHNPWVSFKNLPQGPDPATSVNLRFADFPTTAAGFAALPTVAIVVPGLQNDMHDGPTAKSIPRGDAWLKDKLDPYFQWAKTHNSLLVVTWDESDDKRTDPATGADATHVGLTNPFVTVTDQRTRNIQNRIPTILVGARVKQGEFPEGTGATHVNLLRTLEAMYGLTRSGAQQPNAAAGGIRDDQLITDVFEPEN
jgi:hypothetical protein